MLLLRAAPLGERSPKHHSVQTVAFAVSERLLICSSLSLCEAQEVAGLASTLLIAHCPFFCSVQVVLLLSSGFATGFLGARLELFRLFPITLALAIVMPLCEASSTFSGAGAACVFVALALASLVLVLRLARDSPSESLLIWVVSEPSAPSAGILWLLAAQVATPS